MAMPCVGAWRALLVAFRVACTVQLASTTPTTYFIRMHTTSVPQVVHLCANPSPTQVLAFLPVVVSLAVNNILFVVVDVLAKLQP